ncbi:hypothetical protein FQA39_LY07086 [Lamprigera yunnana]|nr:hypothetical protein FQA39_LY07086 [Lamprigera yunnana]
MDIRLERGLTLEEAMRMIEDDDFDPNEIFIDPPATKNVLTGEDSRDDDEEFAINTQTINFQSEDLEDIIDTKQLDNNSEKASLENASEKDLTSNKTICIVSTDTHTCQDSGENVYTVSAYANQQ